ncbi:MAG TPA: type II toxin-antitoxin system VapC family toxin [Thermoanaerobaculia bacterium]|nr:type II toxin-antitoxin system VapC family toxin [Thermoanaerobaculia bacterium]
MREPDLLVDTSAAVALVVTGHEKHAETLSALEGLTLGLAGHAWFETFSVLTRLPRPARRSAGDVLTILGHNFPASRFLSAGAAVELTNEIAQRGIAGASIYDALVAAAAREHDRPLASRDRRAASVYQGFELELRWIV